MDVQTNGEENVYSSPPGRLLRVFYTLKLKYLKLSDLALKAQAGVPGYLRTTNNRVGKNQKLGFTFSPLTSLSFAYSFSLLFRTAVKFQHPEIPQLPRWLTQGLLSC